MSNLLSHGEHTLPCDEVTCCRARAPGGVLCANHGEVQALEVAEEGAREWAKRLDAFEVRLRALESRWRT